MIKIDGEPSSSQGDIQIEPSKKTHEQEMLRLKRLIDKIRFKDEKVRLVMSNALAEKLYTQIPVGVDSKNWQLMLSATFRAAFSDAEIKKISDLKLGFGNNARKMSPSAISELIRSCLVYFNIMSVHPVKQFSPRDLSRKFFSPDISTAQGRVWYEARKGKLPEEIGYSLNITSTRLSGFVRELRAKYDKNFLKGMLTQERTKQLHQELDDVFTEPGISNNKLSEMFEKVTTYYLQLDKKKKDDRSLIPLEKIVIEAGLGNFSQQTETYVSFLKKNGVFVGVYRYVNQKENNIRSYFFVPRSQLEESLAKFRDSNSEDSQFIYSQVEDISGRDPNPPRLYELNNDRFFIPLKNAIGDPSKLRSIGSELPVSVYYYPPNRVYRVGVNDVEELKNFLNVENNDETIQ